MSACAAPALANDPAGWIHQRRQLFYGGTHADPNSRLWLEYRRGRRAPFPTTPCCLLCGLFGARAELARRLGSDGTFASLTEAGLLAEFEPADARPYPFALRMTAEPVVLLPAEWCGRAWQAATVSILRLLAALAGRGLTLECVRPEFMLLVQGCRPVYARPGSIAPADPDSHRRAVCQLADFFLLPLYLCATGRSSTLRELLARGDLLAPARAFPELAEAAQLACAPEARPPARIYAQIAQHAGALRLPLADTFWTSYYRFDVPLERSRPWPYKNHAAERILATMQPASMLDLASNTGWYARLAAAKGIRVVAVDNDETCVSRLFEAAAEGNLPITPAVGDLLSPLALPAPCERLRLPARQRFASELVLALAICHHLVLAPPWLSLADVASLLSRYTTRYLLTEFVSFEEESHNPYKPDARPGCAAWYTLDNFTAALRRKFHDVVLVPGPPGRRLLLAEK